MIVLKAQGFEVRKPNTAGALGLALEEVAAFIRKHTSAEVEVYQDDRLIGVYGWHNLPA